MAAARLIGIATSALSQTDAAGLLSQLLASFVPAADGKVPVVSSSRLEEAEGNLVAAGEWLQGLLSVVSGLFAAMVRGVGFFD